MKKILQEPLFHFLFIGACLFVLFEWVGEGGSRPSNERIVVGPGRIEQLATVFQKTWQRPPTHMELQGLIDDFVLEEVYYRKAVEMGIDRDDTIIRRRLRQKLEFLTDDVAQFATPTDETLAAFLTEHPELFRAPPTYTFRQVYFNPENHADQPQDWYEQQLDAAKTGDLQIGDPSLLPTNFDEVTSRAVDATFGTGFSEALDDLEVGKWQGPIRSGLGIHLIQLEAVTKDRVPGLSEIRPIVEREWSNVQRLASRREMNKELLQQYEVVIKWPNEEQTDAENGG